MKKIVLLCLFAPLFATGQHNVWHFNPNITVTRYGDTLQMPWAGGLNFPLFSSIDLNQDGKADLFIYDRDNNRMMCLISNGDSTPATAWHDATALYAPM